jgi:hypothetical protein
MKILYALIHHEGNTPIAIYDDPWAAALDFIERVEAVDEDAKTAIVSQFGQRIPLRRAAIVGALTDATEPSNVTSQRFTLYRYDANNGRTASDSKALYRCPRCGGARLQLRRMVWQGFNGLSGELGTVTDNDWDESLEAHCFDCDPNAERIFELREARKRRP